MHRLVLDLLDLAAEAPRHTAKQREERQIEREQHDGEHGRHRPEGRRGGGGDRPVVLVDLDHADAPALDDHRRVGLERLRVRPCAALVVEVAMSVAVSCVRKTSSTGVLAGSSADQIVSVRVGDEPARAVELDPERAVDQHLVAEQSVERRATARRHGLAEVGEPRGSGGRSYGRRSSCARSRSTRRDRARSAPCTRSSPRRRARSRATDVPSTRSMSRGGLDESGRRNLTENGCRHARRRLDNREGRLRERERAGTSPALSVTSRSGTDQGLVSLPWLILNSPTAKPLQPPRHVIFSAWIRFALLGAFE